AVLSSLREYVPADSFSERVVCFVVPATCTNLRKSSSAVRCRWSDRCDRHGCDAGRVDRSEHTQALYPGENSMSGRTTAARWLKFNAVGGIGMLVQLGTLAVLTNGLRVNYLLATALAVEAAVIHNFLWHERFTWADRVHISAH